MAKKEKQKECLACRGANKVNTPLLYLLAFKHSIQRREDIPEGAKNLALPLLDSLMQLMRNIPGSLELAYRRGIQEGEERKEREE